MFTRKLCKIESKERWDTGTRHPGTLRGALLEQRFLEVPIRDEMCFRGGLLGITATFGVHRSSFIYDRVITFSSLDKVVHALTN